MRKPPVFLTLLVAVLAGCTASPPGSVGGEDADGAGRSRALDLDGPWADAFSQAYERASTDEQREILADGVVTDAEYAQVYDAFARCLADVGYEVTFPPSGGITIQGGAPDAPDSVLQDLVGACDDQHVGDVDYLHEQVSRNPENLDEWTIMADCLVREEVVPPSFGRADYEAWFTSETAGDLPYTVDARTAEVAFGACNADPLGLFG
ncbi:hypothetical protein [Cellulomonas triticagri]|uniref:DUF732 domain-containing protein n=1 Tax=Cellulomonas triticagri TaxID=2483352 RepID=A0A3M2JIL8_9CELL|nr:hypothetical protein [Cellulomonas triticagri]RMI13897.1 hypothetical protein EBM89_02695 [Cellulomonas triticagri]